MHSTTLLRPHFTNFLFHLVLVRKWGYRCKICPATTPCSAMHPLPALQFHGSGSLVLSGVMGAWHYKAIIWSSLAQNRLLADMCVLKLRTQKLRLLTWSIEKQHNSASSLFSISSPPHSDSMFSHSWQSKLIATCFTVWVQIFQSEDLVRCRMSLKFSLLHNVLIIILN